MSSAFFRGFINVFFYYFWIPASPWVSELGKITLTSLGCGFLTRLSPKSLKWLKTSCVIYPCFISHHSHLHSWSSSYTSLTVSRLHHASLTSGTLHAQVPLPLAPANHWHFFKETSLLPRLCRVPLLKPSSMVWIIDMMNPKSPVRWGWRWLGHEDGALLNGISALIKETPQSSLVSSTVCWYNPEDGPHPTMVAPWS